ncbi:Exopolysaccharide biosynthesis protein EpsI, predicted pyruvyl transferase [Hyphomicrobium facile]|uniref:Exopolysaccharide biosynthesis protein EpsI, predicted pyruvyl transferase n=2 Tax=Hyphomicrobium facile TaxID=51670 RepID=A0A1I7NWG5_9HYPH|nr:Exopolysaccharide biosynthesis protein EpsI, predicted pyruvyl transferase [Hyphomicrobium facile]
MERFLAEFRGRKVLLIPNEGNGGDCLILASTLAAMSKASIDVQVVDDQTDFKNQTVFLGGGGNLVGIYGGMRRSIKACRHEAARIVLLPHTIRANEKLIKRLDGRTTIWCRDKRSFEHVSRTNPKIDCRLTHDMAFHCDVEDFLSDPECNALGSPLLEASLRGAGVSLEQLSRLPLVRFMRTDKESATSKMESDLDVSKVFTGVADVETSRLRAWCFLKTISVARQVTTDRLHVAIACALLGKECELVDNSYSKNREIYAFSLERFPSISFWRTAGPKIADRPSGKKPLLARLVKHGRRLARYRALADVVRHPQLQPSGLGSTD